MKSRSSNSTNLDHLYYNLTSFLITMTYTNFQSYSLKKLSGAP